MNIRCAILGLLCCLFTSSIFSQELLLPVKSQGKWGYCDTLGNIKIPLQYDLAGLFNPNGLAPVRMNGLSYLIDQTGEIITKDLCKDVEIIGHEVYACYNGTSWKIHGPKVASAPPYDIKSLEKIKLSWIIYTPDGAGLISTKAKVLIQPAYDLIQEANTPGFYILYKDSLMGVADFEGNVIVPVQYQFTDFKEPGIIVFNSAEKLGILSINGKIKTDTLYTDLRTNAQEPFVILQSEKQTVAYNTETGIKYTCDSLVSVDFFDEDYLMVFLPDGINLLDQNMNLLFKEQFHTIRREVDGFVVSRDKLFGYYDSKGKVVHPLRYHFISKMVNNTAIVGLNKSKGIIHASGSVIGEPNYDKAEVFSLTAKLYSPAGVNTVEFNDDGKVLAENTYTNVMTVKLGGFRDMRRPTLTSDAAVPSVWFFYPDTRKWGLNSPTGEILILPSFDQIDRINSVYTKVGVRQESSAVIANHTFITNYKWGLVNHQSGEIVYQPSFLDIRNDETNNSFILVDHQLNYFMKDTASKKLWGPFSWIGEPEGNVRPVAVGGTIKNVGADTTHRKIGSIFEYVAKQHLSNIFPRHKISTSKGDLALVGANYYSLWHTDVQAISIQKYNYLSNFTRKFALMGTKSGEFGIINTNDDTIVFPQYSMVEILKSDSSVFFLKYKKREAYGFIKSNGNWAFEKKFDQDGYFSDGMANMGRNDRNAIVFIDTLGEVSELKNLKSAGHFSEGLVAVKEGRQWLYVNKNFEKAIEDNGWNWVGKFKNGLAPVRIKSEYHYINENGTQAFPIKFEKAEPYNEFGAVVKKKEKWGMINTAGEFIIKPKYQRIKYRPNDSLYYCTTNAGQVLLKPDGTALLKKKLQTIKPFVNGYAQARLSNGKSIVLKKDGTYSEPPKNVRLQSVQGEFLTVYPEDGKLKLTDPQFNILRTNPDITSFKHGRDGIIFAKVKRTGWIAVCDDGKKLFDLHGTPVSGFNEGYAIVQMADGKKMYINKIGEQTFGTFFNRVEPFKDGFARVCTDKGWGLIDVSGNYIITPKYKYIGKFSEGYATVKMESVISISNSRDKPLVDGEYDAVILEKIGFFRVESADRVGWISKTGRVVWNPAR